MAFIIEDGTGVSGANSFVDTTFIDAYLMDRGRETEASWSTLTTAVKQAAAIEGTDYIEQRWSLRFLGNKEFRDISVARATLTLTAQPLDTETVVLGTTTYTFNTILGGANSVLIGDSVAVSIDNLIAAILATPAEAGTLFGIGTVANAQATAEAGTGDTMIAEAREKGTPGNSVASTTTVTGASWSSATLLGGGDDPVPQWLSFPRVNLIDRSGVWVRGIPTKLKYATSEYSVRAVASTLMPDPTVDATGRLVKKLREKVGPIETETEYTDSNTFDALLRPYPAADRLLSEYIVPPGGVIRG